MLQEIAIDIKNGCQHSNLHVDFPDSGIIPITGHNGCGKTNLLSLNAYGITGIVDKSWGSQSDLCKWGTTDGFVEVHLVNPANNDQYHVRRYFKTGTTNPDKLWKNIPTGNPPTCTGRKEVDMMLESLIGIPMRLLNNIMWLRQEDLSWLIKASSTSVDTFLKDLFDTSRITKLRQLLLDTSNSIVAFHDQTGEIPALQQMQKDADDKAAKAKSAIPELQQDREVMLQIMQDLNAKVTGMVTQEDKDKKVAAAEGAFSNATVELEALDEKIKGMQAFKDAPQPDEAIKTFLKQYEDTSKFDFVSNRKPIEAELAKAQFGIDSNKATLESLKKATPQVGDTCPICGQTLTEETKAACLAALEKQAGVDYERIKNITDAITAFEEARKGFQKQLDDYDANTKKYQEWLTQSKPVYDQWQQLQKQHEEWVQTQKQLETLQTTRQYQANMLQTLGQQLEQAQAIVVSDDPALKQRLADARKAYNDTNAKLDNVLAEQAAAVQRSRDISITIHNIEDQANRNKINNDWSERLMRLREGTANDHIPHRFLADKIDRLNQEMSFFCRAAKVPFELFIDPDKHVFMYTKEGKSNMAGKLSGGEKALAGSIAQLSIVKVASPGFGVLMMDEPSVALDETNKGKMVQVFNTMREVLAARHTIAMIPTRDPMLISCATQVVQLAKEY